MTSRSVRSKTALHKEAILFRETFEVPKQFAALRFKRLHFCKAISTEKNSSDIPHQTFDFLILSSKNATRFLRKKPKAKKVIQGLHGDEILRFFRKNLGDHREKKTILYLRSSLGAQLGRSDIVPSLRRLGYRVTVRCTYKTKILRIRPRLIALMKRYPIFTFLVTSPSTIEAVCRALTKAELKSLRIEWRCIGPTTAAYLKHRL